MTTHSSPAAAAGAAPPDGGRGSVVEALRQRRRQTPDPELLTFLATAAPLAAVEAVWEDWGVVSATGYDPVTALIGPVSTTGLLMVLKHRTDPGGWATGVVLLAGFTATDFEVTSRWEDWDGPRRWSHLSESIMVGLVSETGLGDLISTVHVMLQDMSDPFDRAMFPLEYNAVMLLTLNEDNPKLDAQAAAEVAGMQTVAGLGGFDGLVSVLGLDCS